MNHLTVNQMNQFTVSLLIDNNQTLQVLKWHTADSTSCCWPVIVSIIQLGDFCLSVWKFKHFPQLENVFVLNLPTKWAHDSIQCLKLIIIVWTHNWRDQFHSFNLICFLMRIFNHCDWIGRANSDVKVTPAVIFYHLKERSTKMTSCSVKSIHIERVSHVVTDTELEEEKRTFWMSCRRSHSPGGEEGGQNTFMYMYVAHTYRSICMCSISCTLL